MSGEPAGAYHQSKAKATSVSPGASVRLSEQGAKQRDGRTGLPPLDYGRIEQGGGTKVVIRMVQVVLLLVMPVFALPAGSEPEPATAERPEL